VNLLLELVLNERVRKVRILLGEHLNGGVLEGVDTSLEFSEVLDGSLALQKKYETMSLVLVRISEDQLTSCSTWSARAEASFSMAAM